MKFLSLLLAFVLFSAISFAQVTSTSTSLQYTKHWFAPLGAGTGASWNSNPVGTGQGKEACQPCHTPHRKLADDYGTLWNHTMSSASYKMENPTGTSPVGSWYPLQSPSQKCLSCHDGQIALGAFGGATGDGTKMPTGTDTYKPNLASDLNLEDDHPISYAYLLGDVTNTGDRGFFPVATPTGTDNTYKVGTAGLRLYNVQGDAAGALDKTHAYTVECSTCHSAHGKIKTGTTPYPSLLRMSNDGSVLCLTCHKK